MIETSGHLPECAVLRPADNYYGGACICSALRACEQRLFREAQEAVARMPLRSFPDGGRQAALVFQDGWATGFGVALDAARDAVAALFPHGRYPDEHAALIAAIDALKEEK